MPTVARCLTALLLAGFAASAAAGDDNDSWSRVDDVGSDPVSKTIKEQFDFSATGRVDVKNIGGSVKVSAGSGNKVEFTYERRAASQRDFDCETLQFEQSKEQLRIWVDHTRSRSCRTIRADDKLTLTVPRGASVSVRNVGDTVSISGVEGLLRLDSIGDSVTITGAREVDADSIGDSVELEVSSLGPAGIRIDSIGDSVELTLPKDLDARVRIGSVGDQIRGPGLRLHSDDDDYETVLGKGGPDIKISSVGDSVEIHGPQLPQPEREERRRHRRH